MRTQKGAHEDLRCSDAKTCIIEDLSFIGSCISVAVLTPVVLKVSHIRQSYHLP